MDQGEGAWDATVDHLDEDGQYLERAGSEFIAPMVDSAKTGKYGDALGQTAVQVGTLGAGLLGNAGRGADLVEASEATDLATESHATTVAEASRSFADGSASGRGESLADANSTSQSTSVEQTLGSDDTAATPSSRTGKRFDPDQSALIDLANGAKRGVAETDAQTLMDWADEYGVPSRNDIGTTHWRGQDHIHVGPVNTSR